MKKRVVLKIHGDVQGVSFRYYTQEQAQELGLTGWVQNDPEGTVSIVAEGKEEDLKKLIDWIRKGPSLAKIDKVDIGWQNFKGELEGFEIKY